MIFLYFFTLFNFFTVCEAYNTSNINEDERMFEPGKRFHWFFRYFQILNLLNFNFNNSRHLLISINLYNVKNVLRVGWSYPTASCSSPRNLQQHRKANKKASKKCWNRWFCSWEAHCRRKKENSVLSCTKSRKDWLNLKLNSSIGITFQNYKIYLFLKSSHQSSNWKRIFVKLSNPDYENVEDLLDIRGVHHIHLPTLSEFPKEKQSEIINSYSK